MSKLVIRHGLSEANNRENYGTPAFGNPNAGLMKQGVRQAIELGDALRRNDFIDADQPIVAVSQMRRTWETANLAGFHSLRPYALLNEVSHGLSLEDKARIKATRILPLVALRAAEEVLSNPPEEYIWFSHGLLIASMCKVLNIYQNPNDTFYPDFCEIRELPI